MKPYEVLPHTADLKIRAFGKSKEDLFKNSLMGMLDALQAKIKNKKSKVKNIKIQSLDLQSLLVDFLNEILYLTQVNREIYDKVEFLKFTETEIEAKLFGKKVEGFLEDIKAVTFHGLKINQNKDGSWQAAIIYDI